MATLSQKHRASRQPSVQHPILLRLVQAERWPDVEIEASKILRLRPKDPFALKALGCSLTKQAREAEAIFILNQALAIAPSDSEILNNLGNVYLFNGEYELSVEHYKKALAIKPKDFIIWKNLWAMLPATSASPRCS